MAKNMDVNMDVSMDVSDIDIELLLRRLENDNPRGYNYKVLREAAALIRFYREEEDNV